MPDAPEHRSLLRAILRRWAIPLGILLLLIALAVCYFVIRFTSDKPVTYADVVDHFKYGSTGGERGAGIPYAIWQLLPELFADYLPGKGYASLGFIYEKDKDGRLKDLPVGVSRRRVQGIDRVFLNCAICHVGSVRDTPESVPRIIAGMPSNTVDLQAFQRFIMACAQDERFNAPRISAEIASRHTDDFINRQLINLIAVGRMRDKLLALAQRFHFMDLETDFGPGRVDTFNPPKVLLNFRMDKLLVSERVGVCDFPSIWLQEARRKMSLHWDGNNSSMEERNRSAAFGTGATPPTLDRANMKRVADWLLTVPPPKYPYPIDGTIAARGRELYTEYCAKCHGKDGRDFAGEYVGKVTPIELIKTDRWRLDSYTFDLCVNQNLLYAGYGDERFSHFRKTFGYANQPLDGIWLRAPYLHNGSVPTLRDLLEPAEKRPTEFYRGYDVYDQKRVGFVADVVEEKGRKFFLYRTRYAANTPQAGAPIPGNGNFGHEGREYGTELSGDDKEAMLEFLKTF